MEISRKINFELSRSEINNLKFKRSIYACAKIEIGEVFTNSNIKIIRPGMGSKTKKLRQANWKKKVTKNTKLVIRLVRYYKAP